MKRSISLNTSAACTVVSLVLLQLVATQETVDPQTRIDCWPEPSASSDVILHCTEFLLDPGKDVCVRRGCIWDDDNYPVREIALCKPQERIHLARSLCAEVLLPSKHRLHHKEPQLQRGDSSQSSRLCEESLRSGHPAAGGGLHATRRRLSDQHRNRGTVGFFCLDART